VTDPDLATLVVSAAIGLVSTLLVAVAGWLWNQRQKRLDAHAKLLADAYAAVAAYKEFAFAVRRRDPAEPAQERIRISEAMRAVQQELTFHLAWVPGTSRRVSESYDALVGETRKVAGTALRDGWNNPAITTDAQMNMPVVAAALAELVPSEREFLREVQRYLQPVRSRFARTERNAARLPRLKHRQASRQQARR
jgi:hypothetical protein